MLFTKDLSKRWKRYFNIIYEDGQQDGLYLIENTRWTFINPNQQELHRNNDFENDILQPTPEESIDHNWASLAPSTSLPMLEDDSINELDITRTESLAWDMTGTQLVSSSPVPVCNSNNILPDVNRVANFNLHLPISSTPKPVHSRTSQPRRSLPLELHDPDHKPSFFRRFNPFRKKK